MTDKQFENSYISKETQTLEESFSQLRFDVIQKKLQRLEQDPTLEEEIKNIIEKTKKFFETNPDEDGEIDWKIFHTLKIEINKTGRADIIAGLFADESIMTANQALSLHGATPGLKDYDAKSQYHTNRLQNLYKEPQNQVEVKKILLYLILVVRRYDDTNIPNEEQLETYYESCITALETFVFPQKAHGLLKKYLSPRNIDKSAQQRIVKSATEWNMLKQLPATKRLEIAYKNEAKPLEKIQEVYRQSPILTTVSDKLMGGKISIEKKEIEIDNSFLQYPEVDAKDELPFVELVQVDEGPDGQKQFYEKLKALNAKQKAQLVLALYRKGIYVKDKKNNNEYLVSFNKDFCTKVLSLVHESGKKLAEDQFQSYLDGKQNEIKNHDISWMMYAEQALAGDMEDEKGEPRTLENLQKKLTDKKESNPNKEQDTINWMLRVTELQTQFHAIPILNTIKQEDIAKKKEVLRQFRPHYSKIKALGSTYFTQIPTISWQSFFARLVDKEVLGGAHRIQTRKVAVEKEGKGFATTEQETTLDDILKEKHLDFSRILVLLQQQKSRVDGQQKIHRFDQILVKYKQQLNSQHSTSKSIMDCMTELYQGVSDASKIEGYNVINPYAAGAPMFFETKPFDMKNFQKAMDLYYRQTEDWQKAEEKERKLRYVTMILQYEKLKELKVSQESMNEYLFQCALQIHPREATIGASSNFLVQCAEELEKKDGVKTDFRKSVATYATSLMTDIRIACPEARDFMGGASKGRGFFLNLLQSGSSPKIQKAVHTGYLLKSGWSYVRPDQSGEIKYYAVSDNDYARVQREDFNREKGLFAELFTGVGGYHPKENAAIAQYYSRYKTNPNLLKSMSESSETSTMAEDTKKLSHDMMGLTILLAQYNNNAQPYIKNEITKYALQIEQFLLSADGYDKIIRNAKMSGASPTQCKALEEQHINLKKLIGHIKDNSFQDSDTMAWIKRDGLKTLASIVIAVLAACTFEFGGGYVGSTLLTSLWATGGAIAGSGIGEELNVLILNSMGDKRVANTWLRDLAKKPDEPGAMTFDQFSEKLTSELLVGTASSACFNFLGKGISVFKNLKLEGKGGSRQVLANFISGAEKANHYLSSYLPARMARYSNHITDEILEEVRQEAIGMGLDAGLKNTSLERLGHLANVMMAMNPSKVDIADCDFLIHDYDHSVDKQTGSHSVKQTLYINKKDAYTRHKMQTYFQQNFGQSFDRSSENTCNDTNFQQTKKMRKRSGDKNAEYDRTMQFDIKFVNQSTDIYSGLLPLQESQYVIKEVVDKQGATTSDIIFQDEAIRKAYINTLRSNDQLHVREIERDDGRIQIDIINGRKITSVLLSVDQKATDLTKKQNDIKAKEKSEAEKQVEAETKRKEQAKKEQKEIIDTFEKVEISETKEDPTTKERSKKTIDKKDAEAFFELVSFSGVTLDMLRNKNFTKISMHHYQMAGDAWNINKSIAPPNLEFFTFS